MSNATPEMPSIEEMQRIHQAQGIVENGMKVHTYYGLTCTRLNKCDFFNCPTSPAMFWEASTTEKGLHALLQFLDKFKCLGIDHAPTKDGRHIIWIERKLTADQKKEAQRVKAENLKNDPNGHHNWPDSVYA